MKCVAVAVADFSVVVVVFAVARLSINLFMRHCRCRCFCVFVCCSKPASAAAAFAVALSHCHYLLLLVRFAAVAFRKYVNLEKPLTGQHKATHSVAHYPFSLFRSQCIKFNFVYQPTTYVIVIAHTDALFFWYTQHTKKMQHLLNTAICTRKSCEFETILYFVFSFFSYFFVASDWNERAVATV